MTKIKLTEEQILMLQDFDGSQPRKRIKVTESQYRRLFEGDETGLDMPPKSISLPNKVKKNFKKGVKNIPDVDIKIENEDMLGHPVAGKGGDEYNPQSEEENEVTFQSFNEEAQISDRVDYSTYASNIIDFLKALVQNPTEDHTSPFWQKIGVGREELISQMEQIGLIDAYTHHGLPKYKVRKEDFKGKVRELFKTLTGSMAFEEGMVQFGDDIELEEDGEKKFDAEYFRNQLKRRKEPRPSQDQIKKKLADIRAKELQRREKGGDGQVEEDNYPAGAKYDSNAPWNQKDPSPGRRSDVDFFDLLYYDNEHAIFKGQDGKYYLYHLESAERSDYAEYADRDEIFHGRDEDGDPIVDYGEWEMDDYIIDNYVNDNFAPENAGHGLSDWEDGAPIVVIDQELKEDLLSLAKYIKDERQRKHYIETLSNIPVGETTTASSSGAFVGKLGKGNPVAKGRSPEEELGEGKSKKKKRQKAQQMKKQAAKSAAKSAEKSEKKGGLQTVQVSQQDIQNAMKHSVQRNKKKYSRKDKHKNKRYDEANTAPDLVDTKGDKLLSEDNFESSIEFELPEYGRYRVVNVRKPQVKEHSKTYFIELTKDNRPVSSHLLLYVNDKGEERLSFVWKYEKLIPNLLDKVEPIFKIELEKLIDQIKGEQVEETTVAGASVDGGSSGPYVTPKMWAKNKKNWAMNKSNKTAWKKGKIVDKNTQPNISMNESKNMTDTAYPEGEFVEFDDCVRPDNNEKNIAGGCSQGAVDGVVKTKKSGKSVISKEALYYEVAQKTGRTIDEVKNIIEKNW